MVDTTNNAERIRIGIARQKSSGKYGVQVRTPLGIRLDTGALLRLGDGPKDRVENLVFNRCLPDGCFAEKPLTPAEFSMLASAKKLELIVLDLQGKPVTVSLSIKGLNEALRRL